MIDLEVMFFICRCGRQFCFEFVHPLSREGKELSIFLMVTKGSLCEDHV